LLFFWHSVYYKRRQGRQNKKREAKMKKIFLPCEKSEAIARGFWKNPADGIFYRDFIRYVEAEKLTDKILKSYCIEYKQEAIFFEAINKASGRRNSGTCFYKNGKKDVYNKRLTRYADGIQEAIKAIKEFKNRNLNCYTIQKEGKNRFVIFAWIKDERKILKLKRQKRIAKRNILIKKLVKNLADGLPIKYRIQKNIQAGGRFNVYSNKVTISPYNIRHYRIKEGYGDICDYYKNRGQKLNPYVLNNYKICLRFIILHEIGHAYFWKKYISYKRFDIWQDNLARRELYADNFALRRIRGIKK
jgi:hypothetical protein